MMAEIRYASVEGASAAIKAWQDGLFTDFGKKLQMDYARDVMAEEPSPHYKLYVSGFSGWEEVIRPLLEEFKYDIWKITARGCSAISPLIDADWIVS